MLRALSLLVLLSSAASAQTLPAAARAYLGDWTISDDDTNEPQTVVRIREVDGGVEGRIVQVLPTRRYPAPEFVCTDCRGQYRGADLRRIRLVHSMRWNGGRFTGGRIVDPQSDKTYRATMSLESPTRLRVRGYVGIPTLGRTMVWTRTQ